MSYDLTYLSLGAGVQSTAMLIMSALGLHGCPKADVAIFADTQDEPQYVYDHLERLEKWAAAHGLPVERCTAGKLSEKVLKGQAVNGNEHDRFVTIPAFVKEEAAGKHGSAPLRRQCTREFKIEPIEKHVRKRLGLVPKQRAAGKFKVRAMLGISLDEVIRMKDSRTSWIDEVIRMKDSRTSWIDNVFPLIDAKLRRDDCERLIAENGLPIPEKSACLFCPYHSNDFWRALRNRYPAEWKKACDFDEAIRHMQTVRGKVFLHRSLKPLAQVTLDTKQGELFGEECEGRCGL